MKLDHKKTRTYLGICALSAMSFVLGVFAMERDFKGYIIPKTATLMSEAVADAAQRALSEDDAQRFTDELNISFALKEAELRLAMSHPFKKIN